GAGERRPQVHADGFKLKGSWALIRTRGYGGTSRDESRSWLLIKHRDDWAGDVDITTFAPLSVKSGVGFPEILAADSPDVRRTNPPAAGGETGAMLRKIIEQAAALKASHSPGSSAPQRRSSARTTVAPAKTSKAAGRRAPASAGTQKRKRS